MERKYISKEEALIFFPEKYEPIAINAKISKELDEYHKKYVIQRRKMGRTCQINLLKKIRIKQHTQTPENYY